MFFFEVLVDLLVWAKVLVWPLAVVRFFLVATDLGAEPTPFEGLDGFCVPVPVELRD